MDGNHEEKWIEKVLLEAARSAPLADAGFSERVLSRLPTRAQIRFRRAVVWSFAFLAGTATAILARFLSGGAEPAAQEKERALELAANLTDGFSSLPELLVPSQGPTLLAAMAVAFVAALVLADPRGGGRRQPGQ